MLKPTYFAFKTTDVTINFLKKENIKGVILDVDDTLVAHKVSGPNIEIIKWINELKTNNIKPILLSNNFKSRVKPLAKKLDLPYISFGLKPLTTGLKKAIKKISCKQENVLVIGDQIFTDILCANLLGVKSLLVEPIKKNNSIFFKIKRYMEKFIKKNIIDKKLQDLKK